MYISLSQDIGSQFLRGLKCRKHVSYQHRCETAEFVNIALDFDEEKRDEAEAMQQIRRFPFKSNHIKLAKRIRNQLNKMCRGDTRRCVQCKADLGWFQYHSMCLREHDSSPTCSSLIPDMIYNLQGKAKRIGDPCENSQHADIVNNDPRIWSTFIIELYEEVVDYVLKFKTEDFLDCRKFQDWKRLRIPALVFGRKLEAVLEARLQDEEAKLPDEFLKKALQIATGMFVMDYKEVRIWKRKVRHEDADNVEIDVYWKSCYDESSMICDADFVHFWMKYCQRFAYNEFQNVL